MRQSMNEGIPDCPECGGKGMCDEHKLEYLKYCADTAQQEYETELKDQNRKEQK